MSSPWLKTRDPWDEENRNPYKQGTPEYDDFEERAAIMEFHGGMDHIEAENAAYACCEERRDR
jgi:hypothetical protein